MVSLLEHLLSVWMILAFVGAVYLLMLLRSPRTAHLAHMRGCIRALAFMPIFGMALNYFESLDLLLPATFFLVRRNVSYICITLSIWGFIVQIHRMERRERDNGTITKSE